MLSATWGAVFTFPAIFPETQGTNLREAFRAWLEWESRSRGRVSGAVSRYAIFGSRSSLGDRRLRASLRVYGRRIVRNRPRRGRGARERGGARLPKRRLDVGRLHLRSRPPDDRHHRLRRRLRPRLVRPQRTRPKRPPRLRPPHHASGHGRHHLHRQRPKHPPNKTPRLANANPTQQADAPAEPASAGSGGNGGPRRPVLKLATREQHQYGHACRMPLPP